MSKSLCTLIACALALAAGCGSSSSSSGGASSSSSASTSTPNTIGAGKAGSGLKVATRPKYASPTASAPVQSGTVQIAYRNIAIAPDTLRVKVGSTIKWTNLDAVEHNVTSDGGPQKFASKNFGEGGTFQIKTLKAGVIHYKCTIQPTSMNGTIAVVEEEPCPCPLRRHCHLLGRAGRLAGVRDAGGRQPPEDKGGTRGAPPGGPSPR